jgi:outer membrane protein insertion porin family/translocation and assembly module TamA
VSNVWSPQFKDLLCPDSGEGEFGRLNWSVSADFRQPWIFSTRNSFQASLYGERQSYPDVFVREAVGLDVSLTRAIGPRTPLTLSYTPELSRLDAAELLFCTSFLVCTPDDVEILQGANWLAPVGLNFTRSVTNDVLNPSQGYTLVLDLEHAASWTGSNFSYDRAIAQGSWYQRITGGGTVFATGLRLGWVGSGAFDQSLGAGSSDVVHPQKRFYAGGANSVRGFAQNRLGPRVLTADVVDLLQGGCDPGAIQDLTCDASGLPESQLRPRATGGTKLLEGSVELRVPVGSGFQLAAFTDFGQLWQDGLDSRPVEFTPGVGVRYLSPIGPLRMDLAYRFRGGEDLRVVTTQLVAYDPEVYDEGQRIRVNGEPIPYVSSKRLAILQTPVFYGDSPALSWQRLQLHFSIGQAF